MPIETAAAETTAPVFEKTLAEPRALWLADKLEALVRRNKRLKVAAALELAVSEPYIIWHQQTDGKLGPARKCDTCAAAAVTAGRPFVKDQPIAAVRSVECPGCAAHWDPEVVRDVRVAGSLPALSGWRLVAALEWKRGLEGAVEIVVRSAPGGGDLPPAYFAPGAKPHCDHCATRRFRSTCYVLRGEDGSTRQVGASCLADFVRDPDAVKAAEFLASMCSMSAEAEDEENEEAGGFARGSRSALLAAFLAAAAACVRILGAYRTAKQAEADGKTSTARLAGLLLDRPEQARKIAPDLRVEEVDRVLAGRIIEWARSSFPAGHPVPFEANMGAFARLGLVGPRDEGMAAYMVEAYRKALGLIEERARRPAQPEARHLAAAPDERVELDVEVVRVASFETAWGTTYVTTMRRLADGAVGACPAAAASDEGAIVVYKGKDTIWVRAALGSADEQGRPVDCAGWQPVSPGARVRIRATVKEHGEYKGQPQTTVSRIDRVCDGWGFAAEPGTPEAQARDAAIASGRNAPPRRTKARKAKAAPQVADEATDALFALP